MILSDHITDVKIQGDYITVFLDGKSVSKHLSGISEKVFKAGETERNIFKISPSGYGIHWLLLDEDISVKKFLS